MPFGARKFLINPLIEIIFYSHFFHVRDYFQICLVIVRGVPSNFFSNNEKFEFETVSEIYHREILRFISPIRRIRPITHVLQKGITDPEFSTHTCILLECRLFFLNVNAGCLSFILISLF